MTTLREAAQQALEALEFSTLDAFMLAPISPGRESTIKAITALRAALADPVQEPVACSNTFGCRCPKHFTAEPVQEPVAKVELMLTGGNAGLATRIVEIDDHLRERLRPGQLLYTAPPQRKPLSEEEIWALYYALPSDDFERSDRIDFARAIERAHGIT